MMVNSFLKIKSLSQVQKALIKFFIDGEWMDNYSSICNHSSRERNWQSILKYYYKQKCYNKTSLICLQFLAFKSQNNTVRVIKAIYKLAYLNGIKSQN